MSESTEKGILDSIPDLGDEGGSFEGGSTSGGETQGSSNEGHSSAQPTTGGVEQSSRTQPPAQTEFRRRHDGLIERPNPDNPNTRDLVDPVSGRTVATGGIERRIFEDSQRTARENNQLKQQVAGLTNSIRQSQQVIQEAARLGVSPDDQMVAVRVMSDFMRDPVRTLQALVEEVKSKGYQIPFLAEGVSQGMDMSALSRMIDQKLSPIMGRHVQEQQQVHFRQQAERDLNQFLEENQEANNNLDVLGEMLQAQPDLPLQQAWVKMIRWASNNGLDWTRPLKQQIAAMRQQQPPQPQPNETRPLPGQRSVSQQTTTRVGANGAQSQMHENSSWADIIRSAMQESGMQH